MTNTQYTLSDGIRRIKERGVKSALKTDFVETLVRHPRIGKFLLEGIVDLSGPKPAGQEDSIYASEENRKDVNEYRR